jgi:hypothetical protein
METRPCGRRNWVRALVWVGLLLVASAVALPTPRQVLLGWLRGEAFYGGMPTSWWQRELARWQVVDMSPLAPATSQPVCWLREASWVRETLYGEGSMSASWNYDFSKSDLDVLAGNPKAVPVLLELLSDNEWSVRILAARGLGSIGPPAGAAVPTLLQLREQSPAVVAKECEEAIRRIDPARAHRVLPGP